MTASSARRARFEGRLPKWPMFDEREEQAVTRVIRSRQWWREAGDEVKSFESEFARFVEVDHVRAVTNGTQAIELALSCLGLRVGDEVIVPACTFISTASAVLTYGATPIPVDVEADTLCVDTSAAEAAITSRTRAILPVHMAGQVCNMDRLLELAQRHSLDIIEDAAHAPGARWKGRTAGSIGRCSIFSFQAGKLITAGEGGAFATSDPELAAQTFIRHSCGRPSGDREYSHRVLASNMRMTELQGAVLRAQLARFPQHLPLREKRAAYLDQLLSKIPGVQPLGRREEVNDHSHYMYMAWFDPEAFGGRTASDIAIELRAQGLSAFRCFPPVHHTEMFTTSSLLARGFPFTRNNPPPNYEDIATPVSAAATRQVVWLHHSVLLSETDLLDEIADEIRKLQLREKVV